MNRVPPFRFNRAGLVHRFTDHIHDATERRLPNWNADRRTLVFGQHPADHAVGRLHGNTPDPSFAQVLLHFNDHIERLWNVKAFTCDAQRVVDRRLLALFELHVEGRTDHLNDFPNVRHDDNSFSFLIYALAPLTTSMSSLVIAACRIRFMFRVKVSIISPAFRVAVSIAAMRAPCSEAADSSNGAVDLDIDVPRQQPVEYLLRLLLVNVVHLRLPAIELARAERQQRLDDKALLDDGFEFVVRQIDSVDQGAAVQLNDLLGDPTGMTEIKVRENVDMLLEDRYFPNAEIITPLSSNGHQLHFLVTVRFHEVLGRAGNIRVEGPTQTTIGRNHDHKNTFFGTHSEKRMAEVFHSCRQMSQDGL